MRAEYLRRLSRLKNEWPDLYEAITEVVAADQELDLNVIAERAAYPIYHFDTDSDYLSAAVVERYLDNAIRAWRRIANSEDHPQRDLGPYYVDAFQAARESLLGETLPVEEI